ncbi:hypothetical protein [Paenibacillus sp. MBLB4367]|uniref:hypothetical protein n=1 Tax=Paenibacillus sp. MBLB4367 TaxID=3384767 RepID=UPI00390832AE
MERNRQRMRQSRTVDDTSRGERRGRSDDSHRGDHHGRRGGEHRGGGAQTYRRGRILMFLEQLQIKRATLARQLREAEFQSIHPVISGELKAIEQVMEEYIHLFDLDADFKESEEVEERGLPVDRQF